MKKIIKVVLIIISFLIALHSCSKQDITEPSLTIHYYRYDGDMKDGMSGRGLMIRRERPEFFYSEILMHKVL